MAASGASQWQSLGAGGLAGGLVTPSGNLSSVDALDLARQGQGLSPGALDYPDGYLSSDVGRYALAPEVSNLNDKSYVKGVHAGSRISPQEYFWPLEQQPDRGVRNQARGVKTTLAANTDVHLVADGRTQPMPDTVDPNPVAMSMYSGMLPPWR